MRLCHENQRPNIGGWAATWPQTRSVGSVTRGDICLQGWCHSGCSGGWWPQARGGHGSHITVSFVCTYHMSHITYHVCPGDVMYGVCDVPSPVSDPCPISGVRLKCLQNLVLMPIYCITAHIIWLGYLKCAQSEPWQHFTTTIFTLTWPSITCHCQPPEASCKCNAHNSHQDAPTWQYLYHPSHCEPSWEELSCQSNCNYHCFCQFLFWLF